MWKDFHKPDVIFSVFTIVCQEHSIISYTEWALKASKQQQQKNWLKKQIYEIPQVLEIARFGSEQRKILHLFLKWILQNNKYRFQSMNKQTHI